MQHTSHAFTRIEPNRSRVQSYALYNAIHCERPNTSSNYISLHTDTLRSFPYTTYSPRYKSKGRFDVAVPVFLEALRIMRRSLPDNHPDISTTLNKLAGVYQILDRHADAEPLLLESLLIMVSSR